MLSRSLALSLSLGARALSLSSLSSSSAVFQPRRCYSPPSDRLPSTTLSEDEEMLRQTVERFARGKAFKKVRNRRRRGREGAKPKRRKCKPSLFTEKIAPKVKEMDRTATLDPTILRSLFDQGLMGIEVSPLTLPFSLGVLISFLSRCPPRMEEGG